MGNRIFAVDIILSGVMRPMINSYCFGDYKKAAKLLFQLNCFLVGYGEGVGNLPDPISITQDVISRATPDRDYERYYEKYSEAVLKKMGKYIRSVLDSLPKQFHVLDEETQEDPSLEALVS